MHNMTDFLKYGAGVVLVIALIVIGFNVYHKGDDTVTKGLSKYDAYMDSIEYQELVKNAGKTVSGSSVIEALDNLKANSDLGLTIVVKTKANTSGVTYDALNGTSTKSKASGSYSFDEALNIVKNTKSDKDYINPAGKFECSVDTNSNGVVGTITYTQK